MCSSWIVSRWGDPSFSSQVITAVKNKRSIWSSINLLNFLASLAIRSNPSIQRKTLHWVRNLSQSFCVISSQFWPPVYQISSPILSCRLRQKVRDFQPLIYSLGFCLFYTFLGRKHWLFSLIFAALGLIFLSLSASPFQTALYSF